MLIGGELTYSLPNMDTKQQGRQTTKSDTDLFLNNNEMCMFLCACVCVCVCVCVGVDSQDG